MADPKKYRPPLTVRVTKELEQVLRDNAKARDETLSSYVRTVLVESTGNTDNEKKGISNVA